MNEQQIIEKAKKALIEMDLLPEMYTEISVTKKIYKELLTDFPEQEFEYNVHFSNPDALAHSRGASIHVAVDRKTDKLLYAINKAGSINIPEHLK